MLTAIIMNMMKHIMDPRANIPSIEMEGNMTVSAERKQYTSPDGEPCSV
jgi:hypothetical protein